MARNTERYVLRQAAGYYWLLDTKQSGALYRPPMPMNEVGADIWKMLDKGLGISEIVEWISREYEVDRTDAEQDVRDFLNQLKAQNIEFGEGM